jgi:hypothetical protein
MPGSSIRVMNVQWACPSARRCWLGVRRGGHRLADQSGKKGRYLNYHSGIADGATGVGGDEVSAGITEGALMVPPGDVYLDCSYDAGAQGHCAGQGSRH